MATTPPRFYSVGIICMTCDTTGSHADGCEDKARFPIRVRIGPKDRIRSVHFPGSSFANEAPRDQRCALFRNAMLPGFTEGRALISKTDTAGLNAVIWQRYSSDHEETLFSPHGASTPKPDRTRPQFNTSEFNDSIDSNRSSMDNNRTNGDSQLLVDQFQASTLQMMESNQTTLQQAGAGAAMMADIPKYDCNPKNFPHWLEMVNNVRPHYPDTLLFAMIKSKLGREARTHISSLGTRVKTVDDLLSELTTEYDDYGTTMFAFQRFEELNQGTSTLTDHHANLGHLLRGMGETLETSSRLIKARYISSITDTKIKNKLIRKTNDINDKSTLENLMRLCKTETKLAITTGSESRKRASVAVATTTSPCKTEAINVNAATKPKAAYKPNNKSGQWCPIHDVSNHDITACKVRDATECRFCGATFAVGGYGPHMFTCTGAKCEGCNRRGHTKQNCYRIHGPPTTSAPAAPPARSEPRVSYTDRRDERRDREERRPRHRQDDRRRSHRSRSPRGRSSRRSRSPRESRRNTNPSTTAATTPTTRR